MLLEQSVVVACGLALGNFIYARLHSKNYGKAFEITLFQLVAIVLMFCSVRFGF
ncbi:MAG: hypothetical protein ACYCQL_09765 [Acidithiobacillus sp.]